MMSPNRPPLPGADAALFLDVDGTLIDIAPRPDLVVVQPELPPLLRDLAEWLGGAVALVTGRDLVAVDSFGFPAGLTVAAEHGALIRRAGAAEPIATLPYPPQIWRDAADAFVAAHEGTVVEQKRFGIVLHTRLAPAANPAAMELLRAFAESMPDDFHLVPAHAAVELRPRHADKGRAVTQLMNTPPFKGRKPVFIGDDVTDEDGMRAAREAGGVGYHVHHDFNGTTAAIRTWLADALQARGAEAA